MNKHFDGVDESQDRAPFYMLREDWKGPLVVIPPTRAVTKKANVNSQQLHKI